MRKEQRLRKRGEFAAVYRRGRFYGNDLLVLRVLPRAEGVSRFGFAIGKAVGNAVVRNRTRRMLREAVRSLPLAPGKDVVVGARRRANEANYWALREALAALIEKAGGLAKTEGMK